MPRKAKPRWSSARNRWYANIGDIGANGQRTEVVAPETILERESRPSGSSSGKEKGKRVHFLGDLAGPRTR